MGYFLEIWLDGDAKAGMRALSTPKKDYWPHITLVRPFHSLLISEDDLRKKIVNYCAGVQPLPFTIGAEDAFPAEGTFPKVRYRSVTEDGRLSAFDAGLERLLAPDVLFKNKKNDTKIFHVTFEGEHDIGDPLPIDQHMLRLTAIRNDLIWFSYDFVQQRELTREESLDRALREQTVMSFTQYER